MSKKKSAARTPDLATLPCPCRSDRRYLDCCEPAISGKRPAGSAESLMRSRYSAFALGLASYLIDTLAPEKRQPGERGQLKRQFRTTRWTGLNIIAVDAGTDQDSTGTVEFEAFYIADAQPGRLHERSRFRRDNGRWYYVDGDAQFLPATRG
ncbi:YchJ family protein [Marinobacterium rhizophilum]|uniref:Zinc chelation protein SecC n=1 Tax=Marinobacterium rhizophilum TaxID=420402 RepID=A0ABY5HQ19_9GAMM|nr:YchJ family metal-binding protein [Marinobacterium rhizophilum]UTW14069.1 zinc chelation protein SecC [Marinobacterium rhizophilum]